MRRYQPQTTRFQRRSGVHRIQSDEIANEAKEFREAQEIGCYILLRAEVFDNVGIARQR